MLGGGYAEPVRALVAGRNVTRPATGTAESLDAAALDFLEEIRECSSTGKMNIR
jgi:hypothetical protein